PGRTTGVDVDALVLASEAGGRAASQPLAALASAAGPAPRLEVLDSGPTPHHLPPDPAPEGAVVILGESLNRGSTATAGGTDLGPPRLVDGYANGWFIPPSADPTDIRLEWTPQRTVRWGFLATAVTALLCTAVLVIGRRRAGPAPA